MKTRLRTATPGRAILHDFAAEEHEWKQAYDEVMDLAVKKNPSLKEMVEQAKAREHVESQITCQSSSTQKTEWRATTKSVVKYRQKKTWNELCNISDERYISGVITGLPVCRGYNSY